MTEQLRLLPKLFYTMHKPLPLSPEDKPMRLSLLISLICLFVFPALPASSQQVAKTSTAGTKMWVYTPPAYSTSTARFPLLIFLHGSGEVGDDLTLLTTKTSNQYPPKMISTNQWDKSLPFIVVSPQMKRDFAVRNVIDQEWQAAYINEVVDYVSKTYRVDAYRIYVTGVSLGGHGSWVYASTYPSRVAAILPISGKTDPTKACALKNVPVWAFHGDSDTRVFPSHSISMVNAISSCGGVFKPKLTLMHTKNHEGWNEIYTRTMGYDVWNWFLNFRRTSTANVAPYVNAGKDNKILLRSTSYHIAGDYHDWDGTPPVLRWTKVSGPVVTLSSATSPILKITSLKAGLYEFQLAATDNKGKVTTDRVKLEVVSGLAPPAITALYLMNGKTNADIGPMKEGQVINKTTLGTSEFNVRATASTGVGSIRFSVNSDQHTRTVNIAGPLVIKKQTTAPEWIMANGTYVICATPFPLSGGRGTPGQTLCYRVAVTQTTGTTVAAATARIGGAGDDVDPVISSLDGVLVSNLDEGNQWVFNGEDIEGATGSVFEPIQDGEYFVRLTSKLRSDISNAFVYRLREPGAERVIQLFPNPASDAISISGISAGSNARYRIVSIGGAVIAEGMMDEEQRVKLPDGIRPGEYLLVLPTLGGQSIRFVVK